MGIMKTAAVKGIIPAGNKVKELRSNLFRLMTETAKVMDERFGEDGLAAVSEVFQRLGMQDGADMQERLGLGGNLQGALDAWVIIGHIMGSKIEVSWTDENKVETDHPFCPQHEAFKQGGKIYCESVCWPYVESVAKAIDPRIEMEVPKPATDKEACTKALVIKK
jgi:hypothetical protein